MNAPGRRSFLRALGLSAAAARFGVAGSVVPATACATGAVESEGRLPSLGGATEWLNSPALDTARMRGKVVLVQFCTYTCINWLRTLPYIRAWHNAYGPHGLIVVGVHSPEFAFERSSSHVRRAIESLRITYPVAVDSAHRIWRNFDNSFWPALYLADADGEVRCHQFGEGKYEASERMLQKMLTEAGANGMVKDFAAIDARGVEVAADWGSLGSPEKYLGFGRTERFVSPSGVKAGPHRYAAPDRLGRNEWALSGAWTMQDQGCRLHQAGGRIRMRFHARDVHLVMGSASGSSPVRYRVRLDGAPASSWHGGDVSADGHGIADEPRLYQLVRQTERVADRLLEIEFLDADVECFAFTFG